MTEGKRSIIHQFLEEYDIQTAEDIQDALKDLRGGTIREMKEAEMDDHLGYEKSERSDSYDYRNGYKPKRVNSSYGTMEIEVTYGFETSERFIRCNGQIPAQIEDNCPLDEITPSFTLTQSITMSVIMTM